MQTFGNEHLFKLKGEKNCCFMVLQELAAPESCSSSCKAPSDLLGRNTTDLGQPQCSEFPFTVTRNSGSTWRGCLLFLYSLLFSCLCWWGSLCFFGLSSPLPPLFLFSSHTDNAALQTRLSPLGEGSPGAKPQFKGSSTKVGKTR